MDIRIVPGLLAELHRFRQRDHGRRHHLKLYQTRALYRLRVHAYARSPFYGRFHKNLMDRPFRELPVLTKDTLMEHFDELVTDRRVRLADVEAHVARMCGERFLGRYWVNATSGSTGRPGLFLFDRSEWTAILAAFARAQEWAGPRVGLTRQVKTAVVASTSPWHMSAQVGAIARSWWMPQLRLDAGMPIATIVDQLNTWQPELLVAYASMARILAEEQRAGRLQIVPARIFTSSEVLTDAARGLIEEVWGPRLFDQYAATETGSIAAECAQHQGLHILEDQVIVEVVDDHNRPVPLGAEGDKLLVTTLFSRTLPLIRYEINDRVRLAPTPCPCGRPLALIDSIQGRTEDVLIFPANAGRTITVHPHVFHQLMDVVPASGWQIVQADECVEVHVSGVRYGFDDAALAESFRRALAVQGVRVPPIIIRQVPAISQSASGKARLITSRATAARRTESSQSLLEEAPHGRH